MGDAAVADAAVVGGANAVRVTGGVGVTGSGLGALETEDVAGEAEGVVRGCDLARGFA